MTLFYADWKEVAMVHVWVFVRLATMPPIHSYLTAMYSKVPKTSVLHWLANWV